MKYQAIAGNSKIYFGQDIPNMFVDNSASPVTKGADSLEQLESLTQTEKPRKIKPDSERHWEGLSKASLLWLSVCVFGAGSACIDTFLLRARN